MKLIVGLGNPGKKYEHTRHNMGFDCLDVLSDLTNINIDNDDFKGTYGKANILGKTVILFKPTTYMNLSGEALREIVNFFKIDIEDILVIYDEMALDVGKIRIRPFGSDGGHNGMKNIIQHMGSNKIKRIRIGIGKPQYSSVDYVLSKPSKEEQDAINEAIYKAAKAAFDFIKEPFDKVMSKHN